jgi:cell division protein DivIC|tara:strand:+ start:157 stop:456 length:300 start_codon:yes stop_codon:yes gene_type:complete
MEFLNVLKRKKLLFLNIFFLLYISINLFTGERGLISFFEKKELLNDLNEEQIFLVNEVRSIENKNNLLSKNLNFDLVDTLIREKFMFGKKNEVVIKIND